MEETKNREYNKKKWLVIATIAIIVIFSFVVLYNIVNKNITIISNGTMREVSTFKYTIGEVIKEQNLKFDKDDFVNIKVNNIAKENVKIDTKLEDDMRIELIDVSKGTISEYKEIEFETKVVEDKNLLKGKNKVDQEGKNGKNSLVYDVVYHNGKMVDKQFAKELVSEKPVEKIVKKGTKVEEILVASSRGENRSISQTSIVSSSSGANGRHMNVVATAYAGDTITSTGTVPKWGTIAVDPSVIPYGTRVYIPQFGGTFIAEDCGGAIKGNKIDIFMNSESSAYDWGRRSIDIYIQN